MNKLFKDLHLVACIPFLLTSCDPGTEVRRDVYIQEAAKVEEKETQEFNTIELNYELESKATGYFKEQGGLNILQKGQLVFTFDSYNWRANQAFDFGDVDSEITKSLNAKASDYYQDLEYEYGYNLKYYVNPLGLGYDATDSEGRDGIAMTSKLSIRIIFNDYGLLSMLRLDTKYTINDAKAGKDIKVNGEYKVHMQLDLTYKVLS